jgi:hypothetical protein
MNDEPVPSAEVARPAEPPRITVALIPKAAGDLTRLQQRTSLGKTDVVNRAISLYEFLQAQIILPLKGHVINAVHWWWLS